MKTFEKMAAQGDFMIIRVDEIPTNVVPVEPEGDKFVIAHSETGHNHVMERTGVQAFKAADTKTSDRDLYSLFLVVDQTSTIEHMRSFDTHESIQVNPGKYMVKRQREYVAEGFRKAAD